MLKRSRNLKIALLLGGVYVAFLAVLLTGISSAKFRETRVAYTNFGAASFNAVVLSSTGNNSTPYRAFNVFEEPIQLSQVSGYRPGMTYSADESTNTAQKIPFTVANGVTGANASDASVQYEISLRTTGHLPLKYSLLFDGTLYTAGPKVQLPTTTDIETVWYEQKFYATVGEGQPEAIFDLQGGSFRANDYSLVVEWPVTTVGGVKTNDARYMKEVELLELYVTVSSKNMLTEPGYGSGVTIQSEPRTGIVILNKAEETQYTHTLDYRAFATKDGTTSYNFIIENGVGKQVRHTLVSTTYTFEIEVPYTTATQSFGYTLNSVDAEGNADAVALVDGGYRLYDVLYDHTRYDGSGGYIKSFETPATMDVAAWSEPDSQYKLYKVYKVHVDNPVVLDNSAEGESVHSEREYQLILTGADATKISNAAFANKIQIIVTAKEIGNELPAAQPEEGGAAGG